MITRNLGWTLVMRHLLKTRIVTDVCEETKWYKVTGRSIFITLSGFLSPSKYANDILSLVELDHVMPKWLLIRRVDKVSHLYYILFWLLHIDRADEVIVVPYEHCLDSFAWFKVDILASATLLANHMFVEYFVRSFIWTILIERGKLLVSLGIFCDIMYKSYPDTVNILVIVADIYGLSPHV